MRRYVQTAILAPLLLGSIDVLACSVDCLQHDAFSLEDGIVPANVTGGTLQIGRPDGYDPDSVRVVRQDDQTELSISVAPKSENFEVTFLDALEPDATYVITGDPTCSWDYDNPGVNELELTFSSAPPAPFPTDLGPLAVSEPVRDEIGLNTQDGCNGLVDVVYVDIEVELTDSAALWRDALEFETRVNEGRWRPTDVLGQRLVPGQSWKGRARDRVYIICDESTGRILGNYENTPGQPEGEVTIEVFATAPGHAAGLTTGPVTVDLRCDSATDPSEFSDSVGWNLEEEDTDDGGGCASVVSGPPGLPLLLGLATFAFVARRRRS